MNLPAFALLILACGAVGTLIGLFFGLLAARKGWI